MDMYKQTTRKRITEQKSIIATIIKKYGLNKRVTDIINYVHF